MNFCLRRFHNARGGDHAEIIGRHRIKPVLRMPT